MNDLCNIENQVARLARRRCVPLVALTDGSQFGGRCVQELQALTVNRFAAVTFTGLLAEAPAKVRMIRQSGMMQKAYSSGLELWEQPPWIGWFVDANQTTPASFAAVLAEMTPLGDLGANHFLLVAISAEADRDPGMLGAWRQLALDHGNFRLFWLVVDTEMGRTVEHCSLGAVAFLFGGWRRYCDTADSRFQAGPVSLPLNRDAWEGLDLEISPAICRPDLEWHGATWATALAKGIKGLWLQETAQVPELPKVSMEQMAADSQPQTAVPDAQALLSFLLPERRQDRGYWLEQDESGKSSDELLVLDERFILQHYEKPATPRQTWWQSSRERLAQELSAIKNRHYSRQILILQATAKWICFSREKLSQLIMRQLELWLQLPEEPESLLGLMKQRVDVFLGYARGLESANNAYQSTVATFEEGVDVALRRIAAIPELRGILFVLGFIAVVLSSMVLVSYDGGMTNLVKNLGTSLALRTIVFLAVLVLAASLTILVAEWRAVRALYRLDASTISIHRRAVGDLLSKALQQTGREFRDKLEGWAKERDSLRQALVLWQPEFHSAKITRNREDFFSENAAVQLFTNDLRQSLITISHAEWRREVTRRPFLCFDLATWKTVLEFCAVRMAREQLAKISLGQWLDAERPSRQRIEERLTSMVREARQDHPTPPTVCFAPDSWEKHLGAKDTVEIYDASLPWLISLSLLPPPKGRV